MYHSHNQKLNEMGEKAASLLQKMRGCLPASMSEGRKLESQHGKRRDRGCFRLRPDDHTKKYDGFTWL